MNKGPDFIGIGAARSGTSWVHQCLYEHPEIYAPVKEIHFFSRKERWDKGLGWYEKLFNSPLRKTSANKTGEFSTTYLPSPKAAERIHQYCPSVKLIACLRHPVDRAFSNYLYGQRIGQISRQTSFWEAAQQCPFFLNGSCYATQLNKYLQLFPRNQILILIYEDIQKNPLKFIQTIYEFLNIDNQFIPSALHKKINRGRIPKFPRIESVLTQWSAVFQMIGFHKIWWWVQKSGVGDFILKLNTKKIICAKDGFNILDRKKLREYYQKEIEEVEKIIGRRLPEWR
ncbi:MAG: sulfotransferase domain-containing protein [Patescibacteria group bacterium]